MRRTPAGEGPIPRPRYHAALALGLAAATVAATRQPKDALPILIAGVLVDVDHLVDFVYYHLRGPGRFIAPLHGWEYVLTLLAGPGGACAAPPGHHAAAGSWHRQRTLLAAGLALHLALDQVHAPRNPFAYWVLYRLAHRFRWEAMSFVSQANEQWKKTPWWHWL